MHDFCVEVPKKTSKEFQETMQGVVANFEVAEIPVDHCKISMMEFLRINIPLAVSATNNDCTKWGIEPFSKDSSGEYTGIIFCKQCEASASDFYGSDVPTDTTFRFLFNYRNGIVLQLFSSVMGDKVPMECVTDERELDWAIFPAIYTDHSEEVCPRFLHAMMTI
jgi:hypothetical protein